MHWPWNRNKELNEEIEAHLKMAAHDRIAAGASEREAIESARREFGNAGLVKEVTRDMWGWRLFDNFLRDLRYALRQLRKAPGFTLTAMLTLALGIGGTTAIFSLIDAVMLRSLPVADPASLYRIGAADNCCVIDGPQGDWGMYSFALFKRLKAAVPEFEQFAAFQAAMSQLSVRRAGGIPEPLRGEYISGNYFSTLGIRPFAGRLISPADDRRSANPVVVLSDRAWRGIYGGDPSIIGASLFIDNHPFTVIGIAPPGFFGETLRANPPALWLPLHQEPLIDGQPSLLDGKAEAWLRIIGRLRPGATVEGLSARLTNVLRHWMKTANAYPAGIQSDVMRMLPRQSIRVVPAGGGVQEMKDTYSHSLHILLAVCVLVLLVACGNVANLLLARGMARRGDTALRLAMGASSHQLVGQAFTESILLAIGGGIAGLAVAYGAGRLLLALAFHSAHFIPIGVAPSLPVLAFAFALSLATGIAFGTAPAWFATHTDPIDALRGVRRSIGARSSFSHNALLAAQATLSVVLVAGATMLARSLNNLEHQNFGFPTSDRVIAGLSRLPGSYTSEELETLYRNLEDRLDRVPGIESTGLALYNPFVSNWSSGISIAGKALAGKSASWDVVSAGYLQALGMPILLGRGFAKGDTNGTEPVAVVNQTFAKRFFGDRNPLGQHLGIGSRAKVTPFRIVGVVRDAKFTQPREPAQPMFFLSLAQHVRYSEPLMQGLDLRSHFIGGILLKTPLPTGTLEPLLKKTLADVDPNLTILSIRTMQQQIALLFDQERAVASLAGLFGIVALTLAAVGLYGVLAYSVTQRTNEIGVRMALGADRGGIVRLVLHGAFKHAAVGLLIGIPLAIGAGRLISSQLFGVSAWDPLALAIASGSLAVCAFFAAVIPARRAASIEPMAALRVE